VDASQVTPRRSTRKSSEEHHAPPGSKDALLAGCTCPVIDNHYGHGYSKGQWIYDIECPVHSVGDKVTTTP